ncbi:hypothetical protein M0813_02081 [Anaeramoeba flamelloides]|uniref:Uncharacterized protein n=1 Tax=Anaeramoeba flamelloides TaxID=1746091 RepID=A0ABQ8YQE8_9EUKA|nr:hypothetical protein M0813_02081 [Anaeramoeba flamelloides]
MSNNYKHKGFKNRMSRFLSDPFDQTSIDQFEREPSDVFERVSSAGYSVFSIERTSDMKFMTNTLTVDRELSDIDFDLSFDSDINFENALSRTASSNSLFNNDNTFQKNIKKIKSNYDYEIVQPQSPIQIDIESDPQTQPGSDSETEPASSSSSSQGSVSDSQGNNFHEENLYNCKGNPNVENFDFNGEPNVGAEKGTENSESEEEENENKNENKNKKEVEKVQEKIITNHKEITNNYQEQIFIPRKHSILENNSHTPIYNTVQTIEKSKQKQIPMNSDLYNNSTFEYSKGQISFIRPTSPIDLSKLIEGELNLNNY